MAIATLIQPDGTNTCCGCRSGCANCTPPAIDSATCASEEGSGNLRGFSKCQNFNSGDWNLRKYTRRTHSSTRFRTISSGTTCSGCYSEEDYTFLVPDCIWNVATNSVLQYATLRVINYSPCGVFSSNSDAPNQCSSGTCLSDVLMEFNVPIVGCDGKSPFSSVTTGSDRVLLNVPDTVAAALARGSPTSDTNCKTTAGTIGSTSANSVTQISIVTTRSVTVTFSLSSLINGNNYDIEVTLNRYVAGGGGFVDQITDTITFTASGTTDSVDYEVPVNTDYDYEYSSATVAAA